MNSMKTYTHKNKRVSPRGDPLATHSGAFVNNHCPGWRSACGTKTSVSLPPQSCSSWILAVSVGRAKKDLEVNLKDCSIIMGGI